jgi:uncharacterized protein
MIKVGEYNTLKVARQVDFGMYLTDGQQDILIPNKYIPEGTQVEDMLNVFVYKDSEDRLIATTLEPYGKVGDFAVMEVKQVADFGAFLDWGLEKDLLVPTREQHRRLHEGQRVVVKLVLDHKTQRVIGVSKLSAFFKKDISGLEEGQQVEIIIFDDTDLGYVALVDGLYAGMLYRNEVFEPLTIGDKRTGYIKKLRDDGKIDLSLYPAGVAAIGDAKDKVWEMLVQAGGFLPYHDNSSPEEIRDNLLMSKKAFKKAIGGLYKEGKIQISPSGIKQI